MFYNADSGLYLTQYRAYDPVQGRWLLVGTQSSVFTLSTTPENFITSISETSDAVSSYPTASTQSGVCDSLNLLTSRSGLLLNLPARA